MCINYPGTRWFVARNELKDIVDSVYVTFSKVAKEYGFSDYKFNSVKNFIEFGNGSFINFVEIKHKPSDPEFQDLGSTEYTGGWIEEGGEVNEMGATIIGTRVGRHMNTEYGITPIVFITCNPAQNWIKIDYYDKDVKNELPKEHKYLGALATENPFLPQAYIDSLEELGKKSESAYQRLFKGNWNYVDSPDALCDRDALDGIFENDHVREGKTFLTADVARYGSDKAIIGVWRGWKLVEVKIFDISKTTDIEAAIRNFRVKYRIPKTRCIADGDGVGCLDPETEVMTNNGWVKAKNITESTVIVSKDENGFIEHVKPKEIWNLENERFIETEEGYRFTETHLHFYKTRKEHKIKTAYWDDITEKKAFYNDTAVNGSDKYESILIPKDKLVKLHPRYGSRIHHWPF